jgi:hypothetical protein
MMRVVDARGHPVRLRVALVPVSAPALTRAGRVYGGAAGEGGQRG